tara:strand:- start:1245 stop:1760 length:516 start_codon:yes stop_codon:yes gene_type:complete
MKVNLRELLEKLGVDYEMEGYQTQPWQVHDAESGLFCSAEVRIMDGDCEEVEAELIVQREKADADQPKIEIKIWLQAIRASNGLYDAKKCRFEGKDYVNAVSGWDEKACKFFKLCVREMKQRKIPDFDAIIKEAMDGDAWAGGGRGGGGGRSPRIKPNQLLNDMKRGNGGF